MTSGALLSKDTHADITRAASMSSRDLFAGSGKNINYFIPGFGFHAAIFPQEFHCNCLELPGDATIDAMVHTLALHLPEKTTLFAWSLGGIVAIRLAELYPEKITALILISSTPCFAEQSTWLGITEKTLLDFKMFLLQNKENFLQQFIRWVNYPNKNKEIQQLLTTHSIHDDIILTRQLSMLMNTDVRGSYKKLTVPVFHLMGDKDAVLSISIEQLQLLNAHAKITVIENAGHAFFLTHTEQCLAEIQQFLSLS